MSHKNKKVKKLIKLGMILIVLGVLVYFLRTSDVKGMLTAATKWIDGLGFWGPVAFIGIYIIATVAFLPGSILTAAAGAIFGTAFGFLYVIVAATLGAALAFLVSRYVARDMVKSWLAGSDKMQKLDNMVATQGKVVVAITRLVPIFPFNALNYMFGLTPIDFKTYVSWSFLCMAPGTLLYVAGFDAITTGLKNGEVPWPLVAFVGVVFAIVFLLVKSAKKKIAAPATESQM